MLSTQVESVQVHGTALQQSEFNAQICPYCEHTNEEPPVPGAPPVESMPPAAVVPPALVAPPVPLAPPTLEAPPVPGICGTPHVPDVEPIEMTQEVPGQQSPLIVHDPREATQAVFAHTRFPVASRTQGTLLQQSEEDAHACPAAWHVVPRPLHRGMPSVSSWHTPPLLPSPPQQFADAEDTLQA